jgi:hypothetical protein
MLERADVNYEEKELDDMIQIMIDGSSEGTDSIAFFFQDGELVTTS